MKKVRYLIDVNENEYEFMKFVGSIKNSNKKTETEKLVTDFYNKMMQDEVIKINFNNHLELKKIVSNE